MLSEGAGRNLYPTMEQIGLGLFFAIPWIIGSFGFCILYLEVFLFIPFSLLVDLDRLDRSVFRTGSHF